jgi:hypothetical protein
MKKSIIFYIVSVAGLFILQSCNNTGNKNERTGSKPVLLSNPHNRASCVFLTDDERNKPVVSWVEIDPAGEKHFYFSRMDTVTDRFLKPKPIPIRQNASIHEEGMPKIAVKGDGTLLAIYETSTPMKGSRWGLGDINYIQSFDNGNTWTSPQSISPDIKKGLSASFSGIARLGDGEIGVSWLSTNPAKQEHMARPVLFAKTDGKKGFGKEILITRQACQCCRTALSSDKDGEISLVFRDMLPGEVRDISVSTSSDDGATFSKAVSFSGDDWVVDGCPHNGPSAVTRKHHTYVTWFTGGNKSGVYYAELDSSRKLLLKKYLNPNGRFIQLTLMPDGTRMIAYDANYPKGDSMYSRIIINKINEYGSFETSVTPDKEEASYPVVQPVGNKQAVVAWTNRDRVYYKPINTDEIVKPVSGSLFSNLALKKEFPN